MRDIYLVLAGGLGNQMFQYAAARAYSLQFGGQIKLCTFYFTDGRNPDRENSLKYLQLPGDVVMATREENDEVKHTIDQYNQSLCIRIAKQSPSFIKKGVMDIIYQRGIIRSLYGTYKYVPFHAPRTQAVIMQGGFQSPKYFFKWDEIICKELSVGMEPSSNNKRVLEQIQGSESVCVHIRRGDFLDKAYSHLNICTKEYYYKALDIVKSKLTNPRFFVFSNTHEDIEWIRKNYQFPAETTFVDENNRDYQELQLMCSCKHFILANSTFSWWAQHLSTNKERIVCAPDSWDRQFPIESEDIYESSWKIISCD